MEKKASNDSESLRAAQDVPHAVKPIPRGTFLCRTTLWARGAAIRAETGLGVSGMLQDSIAKLAFVNPVPINAPGVAVVFDFDELNARTAAAALTAMDGLVPDEPAENPAAAAIRASAEEGVSKMQRDKASKLRYKAPPAKPIRLETRRSWLSAGE